METVLIVLVVVLLLVNGAVVVFLFSRKQGGGEGVTLINDRIAELTRTIDQKIGETSRTVNESLRGQLSESSKIASEARIVQKEVIERLAKLDETNRQVVSFADQLQHLKDILQNSKQRGML